MNQELSYERALELLDQKLKALEDGELSLDEALTAVDEARTYLRVCHDRPPPGPCPAFQRRITVDATVTAFLPGCRVVVGHAD